MQSIQFAIGALIFFGWGDFLFKRAADSGIRAHHFMLLQAIFFSPSVISIAFFSGALHFTPYALWGSLAGLFIFLGLYNFSRSLAGGAVSINAPLFRMNFIVTAALAIALLGEPLTLPKAFGLAAALVAVWLLVGGAVQRGMFGAPTVRRSLWQALLATLSFGAANFCHKIGLLHGVPPLTMLAAQVSVFVSLAFVSCLLIDGGMKVPWLRWPLGLYCAAVLLVAFVCLLRGLAVGEASVVAPIAQMGFIVAAALGIVLLGERLTARKAVGLAAAAVALVAFAL